MQDWSEGGKAGQYSPSASSTLTQIVPYSASLYTVSILSIIILWLSPFLIGRISSMLFLIGRIFTSDLF